jgi:uncharacterized protein involved in exopolysaccharide biosynthesis
MEESNKLRYNFESFDLILFIRNRFRPLAIITCIGAIISVIVSLVITPRFKSSVILFPAPATTISKSLLTDAITSKTVAKFGEEEEVEQLLQVLHSDVIRQKIVEKYNLMEHYKVDPNSTYPQTSLMEIYNKNISSHRTEFMSIEIEVLDTDPHKAANIANDIAALIDSVMTFMEQERAKEALAIVEHEYFTLKEQMNILEDSLTEIRQKGVIDYESQAEVYNKSYAEALVGANPDRATKLEEKLKIIARYGGSYVSIRDFLKFENEQLSLLKARYSEAKVDATAKLSHKLIVNNAYPAEKKSYPIRWLIVLVSTISTFVIALLALATLDIFQGKTY